jgi:cyclophilin family peptidyl-prolyl cis-trans isomerase|tara:strand:+ start:2215 stop:2922 length:708 start_codon:yes stop_codon:yes gene_type:complete
MRRIFILLFSIAFASITLSCNSTAASKSSNQTVVETPKPTVAKKTVPPKKSDLPLNAETAIPFLKAYGEKHPENKVRIETPLGSFDVLLFKNTPYHRANFIFLTKQEYFNNTYFHRVVPDFIIQGGNSDNADTGQKRRKIGKYLLPPDTRKGHKHHRGVISMPSSEIENPHKLASPYEFFIVHQSPGAYHLDGSYTVFGKVIRGMEVVDAINALPTDKREWPLTNMRMRITVLNE